MNGKPLAALVSDLAEIHSVASRNTRTVQGREHWFFHNPMWNHLGDARGDTAGSYYYDGAEQTIVKSVGPTPLVRADGRPDSATGSDHLPIVFEVEFCKSILNGHED